MTGEREAGRIQRGLVDRTGHQGIDGAAPCEVHGHVDRAAGEPPGLDGVAAVAAPLADRDELGGGILRAGTGGSDEYEMMGSVGALPARGRGSDFRPDPARVAERDGDPQGPLGSRGAQGCVDSGTAELDVTRSSQLLDDLVEQLLLRDLIAQEAHLRVVDPPLAFRLTLQYAHHHEFRSNLVTAERDRSDDVARLRL